MLSVRTVIGLQLKIPALIFFLFPIPHPLLVFLFFCLLLFHLSISFSPLSSRLVRLVLLWFPNWWIEVGRLSKAFWGWWWTTSFYLRSMADLDSKSPRTFVSKSKEHWHGPIVLQVPSSSIQRENSPKKKRNDTLSIFVLVFLSSRNSSWNVLLRVFLKNHGIDTFFSKENHRWLNFFPLISSPGSWMVIHCFYFFCFVFFVSSVLPRRWTSYHPKKMKNNQIPLMHADWNRQNSLRRQQQKKKKKKLERARDRKKIGTRAMCCYFGFPSLLAICLRPLFFFSSPRFFFSPQVNAS